MNKNLNLRSHSESSFARSVLARRQALLDVAKNDVPLTSSLVNAVGTTTAFANWDLREKGISKMGRNTLRKVADQVLNGALASPEISGWRYLDSLRRGVKAKSRAASSNRGVAAKHHKLLRQKEELLGQLQTLEASVAVQTKAYLFLFQQLRGLAKNSDIGLAVQVRIFNILNDHDELYGAIFGPEISDAIRPKNVEEIQR